MALSSQIISINFATGVDQKTDDKLTTQLLTADNAVLRKTGTIEQRPGFVADGLFSISANPVKIFPFNNGEFIFTDYSTDSFPDSFTNNSGTFVNVVVGNQQHSMARLNGTWIAQEPTYPCTIKCNNLLASSSTIGLSLNFIDVALCGVSATSSGFVVATDCGNSYLTTPLLYDLDTNAKTFVPIAFPLTNAKVVSITSTSVTAVAFGQLGSSNTTFAFCNVSATSISSAISATILGLHASGPPAFDAVVLNNKIYFSAFQVTTESLVVGWYDPSNGSTSTTVIAVSTTLNQEVAIAAPAPGTDRMRVFWRTGLASLTVPCFMASYSFTLSQILAPTAITVGVPGYSVTSVTTTIIAALGAVENIGATSVFLGFSQASITNINYYSSFHAEYSNTSATIVGNLSPSPSRGTYGLMSSRPFLAHGRPSMMLTFSATGQSALFVATTFAGKLVPIGKCLSGIAGPSAIGAFPVANLKASVVSPDGNKFYSSAMKASNFRGINGVIFANVGSSLISVDLTQSQPIPYVKRQDCTYLGGGALSQYDGQGKTECGFLSAPIINSISVTSVGGVNFGIVGGLYSVVISKEFTDQAGYTSLGMPSVATTFTTSTTTSIGTIAFTDGPNAIGNINRLGQIKYSIFRTLGNGSIYYRDSTISITSGLATSYTPFSVAFQTADTQLANNDIIYTQGGALPHWTPDSCDVLFLHNNRLFCNDPFDQSMVRYSNSFIAGSAPAFSILSTINIPGSGAITAGASLDSTAIIFRLRSVHGFAGTGPDDTGLNGTFSDGQIIFADIGCINQRNLCRFRDGIVFKSPDKGFYLLTRDLQLSYVGAHVEDYNSKTVVSSEVVGIAEADGTAEECRFLHSDGTLLIYNYYNGQWTTGTLSGCVDAVQTGGRYVVVNTSTAATNARVFQQSTSTYTDDFLAPASVTTTMTVETAWIKMSSVQGFQRIWNTQIIGKSQGPGNISVETGYDYEAAYAESHTATMSSITAANYAGGNVAQPQFEFTPARQKCESIRFRIKTIPAAGNTTGVFRLTNISLECGIKKGRFHLPDAKGIA